MKRICVFASSSPRTPARYLEEARVLGAGLAGRGLICVNGGGHTGCMGALNDACLAAGGQVRGVILRQFLDQQLQHRGLSDLEVVSSMRERKRLLGDQVDAYITLPGGPGTWEEFWEVAVERQIATHSRPVFLVNTDGYYAGFLLQARRGEEEGFLYGPAAELFTVLEDVAAVLARLPVGGLTSAATSRGLPAVRRSRSD